jgi:hypothetical protein
MWSPPHDEWNSRDADIRSTRGKSHKERYMRSRLPEEKRGFDSILPLNLEEGWRQDQDIESTVIEDRETASTIHSEGKFNHKQIKQISASSQLSIPKNYFKTIEKAFGQKANLYTDVLKIPECATPKEVRIAYFRRGREVLCEGELREPCEVASMGGSVTSENKQRFQAISMAYEILGNPAWKEEYADHIPENEIDHPINSQELKDLPIPPIIKRSSSLGSRKSRSQNGVRWSEEVEELVFDQDPLEIPESLSRSESRRSKKKKKSKSQVVIDDENLAHHLEKLDRKAHKHMRFDFFDDLEASIEDLLSLGSSSSRRSNPKPNIQEKSKARKNDSRASLFHNSFRNVRMPTDIIFPATEFKTKDREGTFASDDSVSTLSGSFAERKIRAAQPKPEWTPMTKVSEEEISLQSNERAINKFSELQAIYSNRKEAVHNDAFDDTCEQILCGSDDNLFSEYGERGCSEYRDTVPSSAQSPNSKADTLPEFHTFLAAYIKSLACDLYEWVAYLQDLDIEATVKDVMETMMITDNDLDGIVDILRSEMNQNRA